MRILGTAVRVLFCFGNNKELFLKCKDTLRHVVLPFNSGENK